MLGKEQPNNRGVGNQQPGPRLWCLSPPPKLKSISNAQKFTPVLSTGLTLQFTHGFSTVSACGTNYHCLPAAASISTFRSRLSQKAPSLQRPPPVQPPQPFLPFPHRISVFILKVRHPSLPPTVLLRGSFGHQLRLIVEFSVKYKKSDLEASWEQLSCPFSH